jgi:VanZ family protein
MKKLKNWLPVIFWCGVIFYFSSIPSLHLSIKWQFIIRKIAHIIEFGILLILLFRSLKKTTKFQVFTNLFISIGITLAGSILDEFHQTFVQGRVGTFRDVFIDMIGVAICVLIILFIERKNLDNYDMEEEEKPEKKKKKH